MSFEEDTELRDIVLETLDGRGVVGHTKALLRANIFTALEENTAPEDKIYKLNKRMKESLTTPEGQLMAGLVMDYFNSFQLEFSKMVFEPETGYNESQGSHRADICKELSLPDDQNQRPLLSLLVSRLKTSVAGNQTSASNGGSSGTKLPLHLHTLPSDLTSKQIADAKQKFAQYDKDGSGTIDKDELRQLFIDMFPGFHRNMLERYVNDEFHAADHDFSAASDRNTNGLTIEFDEFLDVYKRLFLMCRSVTSLAVSDLSGLGSTTASMTSPRSPSPRQQSKIPVKKDSVTSPSPTKKESPRSLPSLTGAARPTQPSTKEGSTPEAAPPKATDDDKTLKDLGFDVPDNDDSESIRTKSDMYDDDFEKSNASSIDSQSRKNSRLEESVRTEESISTDDPTEKIDDDDDDLEDLLKDNDVSWGNETTDKSITDDESLRGVDYWESARKK